VSREIKLGKVSGSDKEASVARVNPPHPLFMTTRVSCAFRGASAFRSCRCSRSIYDEMTRADRIIIRLDTVITAYGYVLFHDYLLMPSK